MSLARALSLAVVLSSAASACASAGTKLVTLMPGVVNDPKNRTLRREILQFGSGQFCKEMKKRGAPLKTRDDAPAVGRFFIDQCDYRELDNDDAFVQFSGAGYVYTQPTGRVGFRAAAAITYNPDMLIDGGTMYAYFRPRNVQSSKFEAVMIERQTGSGVAGMLLGQTSPELVSRIGSQIVSQELSKGFTVLREPSGEADFALGILEKGQRPFHPYNVRGSDKLLLASDWSEVHSEQREFVGPFSVEQDGRALFLTMNVDGAPNIDLFLMRRETSDPWLRDHVFRAGVGPLPGQPLAAEVVPQGKEHKRTIPLQKGVYYLVLDHSSTAGSVAPPGGGAGLLGSTDLAAVVRYVAQLGDAP